MGLGAALWRTRGYLLPQLRHFLLFGALSGVGMLLELAVYLVGFDLLTNKVFRGEPLNAIQAGFLGLDGDRFVSVDALGDDARRTLRTVFLVLIGSLLAAGFLLGTGLRYYLTWILQRVNQALRLAMVERAVHLSLRYHDESPVGDAIYRVYQDSAMVTNVVQNALIQPLTALANLLVALVALTFFDPYLGVLFLFGLVPSVVAVRAFTVGLRRRSDRARRANSALTAHIQESVNGARVLKANGAEGGAFDTFRRYSYRALDRAYELRRSIAVLNLIVFLLTATTVIVADYLMAGWVRTEASTFGYGLVALVGFAAWNLGAFQAARDRHVALSGICVSLAMLWGVLQDMGVGLKRAFFLLDLEPGVKDRPHAVALPAVGEGVRFQDVEFGYRAGIRVINRVTFTAPPGAVTAVVGASGAGKSTLMSLLLRLYDVDAGRIEVGGMDIRDIRLAALRRAVAIVLQENALFPTSVLENIRYAVEDAPLAAVERAAAVACADEFIASLPSGYATLLGERGAKLSTGQRQRLSIARAVLKDAPILILDEPTAALDVHTERRVLDNLGAWAQDGKIVFLITHRMSTIRQAEQILFVENGAVVEQGDHGTLMAHAGGRYRAFATASLATAGAA